jgi:hypothetical protein
MCNTIFIVHTINAIRKIMILKACFTDENINS